MIPSVTLVVTVRPIVTGSVRWSPGDIIDGVRLGSPIKGAGPGSHFHIFHFVHPSVGVGNGHKMESHWVTGVTVQGRRRLRPAGTSDQGRPGEPFKTISYKVYPKKPLLTYFKPPFKECIINGLE